MHHHTQLCISLVLLLQCGISHMLEIKASLLLPRHTFYQLSYTPAQYQVLLIYLVGFICLFTLVRVWGGICDVCMYMYKCACPCKCVKDVHFGTSFHILYDCFCDACLSGPAGPGPWNPPLSNLQYEITGTHALPCPAFSLGSGGSELSSSCLPFTL